MITREEVADLQPGDVVELTGYPVLKGATLHGPIRVFDSKGLAVGPVIVRHRDGTAPSQYEDDDNFTLTVVSRAPRLLYVNHPRTEAVTGDVVRDADTTEWNGWLYVRSDNGNWLDSSRGQWFDKAMPARLRLLVDGETGQVVP